MEKTSCALLAFQLTLLVLVFAYYITVNPVFHEQGEPKDPISLAAVFSTLENSSCVFLSSDWPAVGPIFPCRLSLPDRSLQLI